jgi:hypothetical protein
MDVVCVVVPVLPLKFTSVVPVITWFSEPAVVDGKLFASPLYWAVITWVPTVRKSIVAVAVPLTT